MHFNKTVLLEIWEGGTLLAVKEYKLSSPAYFSVGCINLSHDHLDFNVRIYYTEKKRVKKIPHALQTPFLGNDLVASRVCPETASIPGKVASLLQVFPYILSTTADYIWKLSQLKAILNTEFKCCLIQPED